jgi:hypothetical protein
MKALKKGKEYTRVEPLPDEWLGPKTVALEAEVKNDYQSSFRELKLLLNDDWGFCGKEGMRKFERSKADAKKPNKKLVKKKNERKQKTRA